MFQQECNNLSQITDLSEDLHYEQIMEDKFVSLEDIGLKSDVNLDLDVLPSAYPSREMTKENLTQITDVGEDLHYEKIMEDMFFSLEHIGFKSDFDGLLGGCCPLEMRKEKLSFNPDILRGDCSSKRKLDFDF